MNNIDEIAQAIAIGLMVSLFLVNTSRVFKAIEVLKECLAILHKKLIVKQNILIKFLYEPVHRLMIEAYCRINDNESAIDYCRKLLALYRECGNRAKEGEVLVSLANLYKGYCKYEEAKELFEEAISISKEIGDRQREAESYSGIATVCKIQAEYVKAEEYLKKSIRIKREIGDRQGEAADYGILGSIFRTLGKYFTAREYHEKALVINKEICNGHGMACAYGNLGTVFHCLAENVKAKECLENALAIGKEIGDKKGQATYYTQLGAVLYSLGERVKAKKCHGKALAIANEIGDKYIKAASYRGLGIALQSLGENRKAVEHLEKALVIETEIGDREGEASCYGNLGAVFQYSGEYRKAKEHYEKALAIRWEIGDKEGEATDYGNLGTVFHFLNENVTAVEYINKGLVICKEIGDKKGEASSYGNLGNVFHHLGEYIKAKEYYEKELAMMKYIGDRQGEASSCGGLANLFNSLGEYAKATKYTEKALAIRKEIGDRHGESECYRQLGVAFHDLGKYEKANEFLEKSLAIAKAIGDREGEACCYGNLGALFRVSGEYTKAKEYHENALEIRKQIGDREGESVVHANLGTVLQNLGEHFKAEEHLTKAVSISKEIGDVVKQVPFLSKLAWLKFSEGKTGEAYLYLIESIQKCEDLRDLLGSNDPFKISFSDKNNFPYWTLSGMLCSNENPHEALYVSELGRARALVDLMAAQYSVEIPTYKNSQSWLAVEKVIKKENNCSCLYLSYDHQNLFVWIIKRSGFFRFRKTKVTENVTQRQILTNFNAVFDRNFRIFRVLPKQSCEDRSLNDIRVEKNSKPSAERTLSASRLVEEDEEYQDSDQPTLPLFYKMIIAPVVDIIEEPEIIIVPDRSLYKVPFAALSDENGKYLSETFRIRVIPSLMTLKLIQDSPEGYHSQTGVLIVGDPKVGRVLYKGYSWDISSLPFARREVEMIGKLLDVQPLIGEHATKQAVLQRIHSVSLVHFAAHGNAERGEIALSPQCTSSTIPEEVDYLLTMSDISRVRLRAKLVVLSCCHSGSGQIRTEGVVGIARAFLGSGARSVLVALWAIEDSATEQFMRLFYEHLVRGESASECLHEAMKWVRGNGYSEVAQWAPFMLIGDNVAFEFGK